MGVCGYHIGHAWALPEEQRWKREVAWLDERRWDEDERGAHEEKESAQRTLGSRWQHGHASDAEGGGRVVV